jgi:recombination endonuclease VII
MATQRERPKEYHADYRAKNREKLRKYQKEYKLKNRLKLSAQARQNYKKDRSRHLRKYGISQIDYDVMLVRQGGRCAICRTDNPGKRSFHVDHCHKTGIVRGLLCPRCNSALGFIRDNMEVFVNIRNYLWTPQCSPEFMFKEVR